MALFGGGGSRSSGRGSGRGGGGGGILGRGNDEDDDPYNYNISTASKASKGKEGSTGTPTRAGGKVGGVTPSSEDVLGKAAAYLKKYSPNQPPQAQQRTPSRAYELNSDEDDSMDSMDSFKDQRSRGADQGRGAGGRETGGGGSYGSPGRSDQKPDLSPRKADPFSQVVKFDSPSGRDINFLGITGVDIPATRSTAGYATTSPPDDRRTAATSSSRPPIVMPPSSYDTNVSAFSRPFRPGSDRLDDDDDASYHDAHRSDDSDDDDDESTPRRSGPSPPSSAAVAGGGGAKKFLTINDLSSILADPSDPPTVVPDPVPSAYRPTLTSNLSTVMEDAIRSEDEANDPRRTPDSVEEEEQVATKPTAARPAALSPMSDAYASDFDDAVDSPVKTTHPAPTVYAAPAPAPASRPIVPLTAAPVTAVPPPPPPPPVAFAKPQPPPAKRADEATHAVQTVLRPPSSLPAHTAMQTATTTTAQPPVESGAVAARPRVSIVYDLDSRQLDKVDRATQCSGNEATVQATVIPSSMLSALPPSSRSSLLHRKGPLSAHPRLYPPSTFKLSGSKALRHMMLASAAAYPETYISLATLLPPPPPPPSMAQVVSGPVGASMGEASMGSENRRAAQNAKVEKPEDDGSMASQPHKKPSAEEGPTTQRAKPKTATTGTSMEEGEEKQEARDKGKGRSDDEEEGGEEGGGKEEPEPARTPTRKGGKQRAHRGAPDGCGHVPPYPCYHPHYYPPMPYGYPPSAPVWGPGPPSAPGMRPSDVLANCFNSLQQQDNVYKAMHAQLDNIAKLGRGGDGKRSASTSAAPATKARQSSRATRHEEESQGAEGEDDDGYSQASDDFEPDSEDEEGPSQASRRSSHRPHIHKARQQQQQSPPRGARLADSGSGEAEDTCASGYSYHDNAGMLGEGLEDSVMSTRALYRQQLNILRHQLRQMRLHAQYAGVRQTSY